MNPSPLRKLLWIFAALAVMILLAPIGASAHDRGHAGPGISPHLAVHHALSPKSAFEKQAAILEEVAATPAHEFGALDGDPLCSSGCCSGTGCCPGTIISEVPALDPPAGPQQLVEHAAPPRASARGASLLEPPNALA